MELTNKQTNALSGFVSTYKAFVNTLADTYKDQKELGEVQKQAQELKAAGTQAEIKLVENWRSNILPHVGKIRGEDASLFVCGVKCLLALKLPQLWVSDKLSANSKKYVWLYLKSLTKNAEAFMGGEEGGASPPNDIQPPMELPNIPGIKQIYENMPTGILEKVKSIADRYGEQIDSGEKTIESIKFNEISQELFSDLDPNDMKSLVENVGQVLKSMTGGAGDNQDFSQLFNFMNKKGGV